MTIPGQNFAHGRDRRADHHSACPDDASEALSVVSSPGQRESSEFVQHHLLGVEHVAGTLEFGLQTLSTRT